jgi:hypothetical protein
MLAIGTGNALAFPLACRETTPQDRVTSHGGGLASAEYFCSVGLRASVMAPGNACTSTYDHLEPRNEKNDGGLLVGYSVKWLPDVMRNVMRHTETLGVQRAITGRITRQPSLRGGNLNFSPQSG